MNATSNPTHSSARSPRSGSDTTPGACALEDAAWLGQADGSALYCNPPWQALQANARAQRTSHPLGDSPVNHWIAVLHPDDQAAAEQAWRLTALHTQPLHFTGRVCTAVGWQPHTLRSVALPAELGSHAWLITATLAPITTVDVTHNAPASPSQPSYKSMLDTSGDCIKMLSLDGRLLHVNASGCAVLDINDQEGFGQSWLDFLPKEFRTKAQRALKRVVGEGKLAHFTGSRQAGNKVQHWENKLFPVLDSQGKTSSVLCLSRDVSLQYLAEKRLRDASEIDVLTGLPNRRRLHAELSHALRKYHGSHFMVGLMLLDLDHFKHVNSTLGHVAGDHVLRVLGKRLSACLPTNAFMARLGGDEFAIIHAGIVHMNELLDLAKLVHSQIDAPIAYGDKLITSGLSMGCALYPRDAQDLSGLLKVADTALNDIKAGGRGGVQLYSIKMMQSAIRAADQLERARTIVRENTIEPHYQPKVTLADDRVIGFEALLRWRDSSGLHYPRGVEEAFKSYEVSTKISEQMRKKVFADMARWYHSGLPLLPVSLNAAPVEFLRDDYAERLLESIQTYGLPTSLIEIEVTEHSLAERNAEYVGRSLNVLKKAGVRIALDDFGTGHSSFTNLRDYPVDCIKIDRSFIRRMQDEVVIAAIVKAVCQLGPALNLQIIAEGVETRQQCNALLEVGCEVGQGFLFSPAMPHEAVEAMLSEWKMRFQLKSPDSSWQESKNQSPSPLYVIR